MNSSNKILIALFLIALAMRLLLFWPVWLNPEIAYIKGETRGTDEFYYHNAGIELSRGESFNGDISRVPGYPLYLGVFYKLFSSADPRLPLFIQILATSALVLFVAKLASDLFGKYPGIVAGIIYAASPVSALFADRTTTEPLGSVFYFLSLYFLHKALQYRGLRDWRPWAIIALAGVVLGFALMVAKVGIYLLYVIPIALFLVLWSGFFAPSSARTSVSALAPLVFFIAGFLIIFPWMARNETMYGTSFLFAGNGQNLFYGFAGATLQEAYGLSSKEAEEKLFSIRDESAAPLSQKTGDAAITDLGFSIIAEHPFAYAYAHAKSVAKGLFGSPMRGAGYKSQFFGFFEKSRAVYGVMVGLHLYHIAYFAVYAIMLVFGYAMLWQRRGEVLARHPVTVILVLMSLYFIFIYGPMFANGSRYHVIAIPFNAVIAGLAAPSVLHGIKQSLWK
ncbi:MAG: glycosyltransferase family 39 protein [Candidatus Liptonbacteria bacterium]|nr:glycosyltransferase family 39 protein [Candidatus Liptonbacteria bacterium]